MPHSSPSAQGDLTPQKAGGALRLFRSWLLKRLDALLSEPLRMAPASELTRARVLAGTTTLFLVFNVLYLLVLEATPHPSLWIAPGLGALVGFVGALLLLRRATSPIRPAMLLCMAIMVGSVGTMLTYRNAYSITHASTVLIPALAVYLMGPRLGLVAALLQILLMGLVLLVVYVHLGIRAPSSSAEIIWTLYFAAAAAIIGVWLLGALHSTARDAAQATLERTLKELHDSEHKLSSLFENTDDLACSLDTEGRILIANTALKQAFARRFGQEPAVGQPLLAGAEPAIQELWARRFHQVLQGRRLKFEFEYMLADRRVVMETSMGPIRDENGQPAGMVLFARDITARKEAETRMGEMHRTLVDVSRQAGMAEIATGVLHNVGNALNSVNISASLIAEGLRKQRVSGLARAATLLQEHSADLASFLTTDPRGQQLPAYLQTLSKGQREEQEALLSEASSLTSGIEHIKSIISTQQKHARTVGAVESLSVPQLIDEAMRLHAISFERLNIAVERDYGDVPPIVADRHKLLQILLNLMTNARHALVSGDQQEKRLRIRVRLSPDGGQLLVEVSDNGMGIAPEHLPRIFTQGFTTKKEGHGFGLHISALAAMEMKGRLTCTSQGLGQGATFTLELPLADSPASSHGGAAREDAPA